MTIINQKSISGITSITFASTGDDLLTFHSNNGTERFRIDNSGNTKITAGIVTTLTVTGNGTVGGTLGVTGDVDVADKIVHTGDTNTAIRFPAADTVTVETGGSERLRIDSSGDYLLLGGTLRIKNAANDAQRGAIYGDASSLHVNSGVDNLILYTGGGERLRIDSTGRIGIGTDSFNDAAEALRVQAPSAQANSMLTIKANNNSSGASILNFGDDDFNEGRIIYAHSDNSMQFRTNDSERLRIDSSGRLLLNKTGTPSAGEGANAFVFIQGNTASNTNPAVLALARGQSASEISGGASLGVITFTDDAGNDFAQIKGATDGGAGTDDHPGRILFLTTGNNSSSPTEQARIGSDGFIGLQGTTASGGVSSGKTFYIQNDGHCHIAVDNTVPLFLNRNTSDGQIIAIRQNNTLEGNISVSGSTVSLQGAHLTRWSQLVGISTNVISDRPTILRGSVLSNLDEMCEWGDEDNEQLNCMKVSDVEGDPNVAGVFQDWDDDDDTYTNDLNCAMTGDFIIRIAQGTTVARGDLLMSAGDGTAKPQGDDIIRSKTIAKVTSTTVSTTYSDGSYCVPCVLMAC